MLNTTFIREVGIVRWSLRFAKRQISKRILRRDNYLRLPTGLNIRLPRNSRSATEAYMTHGDIDWGSEAILARFADPAGDFLDIGAHIGYYSVYLAPEVRRVYAFEPDLRNLPALRDNARRSGNIEVIEMAVSSMTGEADFSIATDSEIGTLERTNGKSVRVHTITIDQFASQQPGIQVRTVKTDIEGHDISALIGMSQTVQLHQPLILSEVADSKQLPELCRKWGFAIFAFVRQPDLVTKVFCELRPENLDPTALKMVFLVPPRLQPDFRSLANRD
jgi:FkbM family methyltransferase